MSTRTSHFYTHELSAHFVYVYRDPSDYRIRYVGLATHRSSGRQRPEDHLDCKQESCAVRPWAAKLKKRKLSPIIEVINCASKAEAKAVESALISALWVNPEDERTGLLNSIHGTGEKFRPLGFPTTLDRRRLKPRMGRADIADLGPALVVNLSIKDFEEESDSEPGKFFTRPGAGTFSRLTDQRTADRISAWWQVGRLREQWLADPAVLPKLIIGVTGPVQSKWIYGAMAIDKTGIQAMQRGGGGLYRLPVKDPLNVDYKHLRGRLMKPYEFGPRTIEAGRVFGAARALQFDWVTM